MSKYLKTYSMYYISVNKIADEIVILLKKNGVEEVDVFNTNINDIYHNDLIEPTISFIQAFLELKLNQLIKVVGLLPIAEANEHVEIVYKGIVNNFIKRIENEKCILMTFDDYYSSNPSSILVHTYRALTHFFVQEETVDVISLYSNNLHKSILEYFDAVNFIDTDIAEQAKIMNNFREYLFREWGDEMCSI